MTCKREKTPNPCAAPHSKAPEIADGADGVQAEPAILTESQLDVVRWLVRQALENAEKANSDDPR